MPNLIISCPTSSTYRGDGFFINVGGTPFTLRHTTPSNLPGPVFNTQIQVNDNGCPPANDFVLTVWLCSGQGATAVDEVVLAQLTATSPNLYVARTTVRQVVLPSVGRNWDAALDSFAYKATGSIQSCLQNAMSLTIVICDTQVAQVDCCTETLQKLDLVLKYVSRTWPVVPA